MWLPHLALDLWTNDGGRFPSIPAHLIAELFSSSLIIIAYIDGASLPT